MNQAEVIHAGWAHRDRSKLAMLDACQADVRDSLVLDVTLKNFQNGSTRGGGSGPSFAERRVSKHRQEMEKANRMGKEIFADEDTGLLIDPK